MPILTGKEIARRVKAGEIVIEPFDSDNVNPNSYNLRLGDSLLVYQKQMPLHEWHVQRLSEARRNHWVGQTPDPSRFPSMVDYVRTALPPVLDPLDMAQEEKTVTLEIPKHGLDLFPGVLYLGATMEYTESPNLAPRIDGRSSIGRLGKMIHVTAGFGDDNFCGDWTLEIVVVGPLRVYPGVPVCQITFSTLEGERTPYDGRYQGQRGPKPSRLWTTIQKFIG